MQAFDLALVQIEQPQPLAALLLVGARPQRAHAERGDFSASSRAMSSSLGSWVTATMAVRSSVPISSTASSGMRVSRVAWDEFQSPWNSSRGSHTVTWKSSVAATLASTWAVWLAPMISSRQRGPYTLRKMRPSKSAVGRTGGRHRAGAIVQVHRALDQAMAANRFQHEIQPLRIAQRFADQAQRAAARQAEARGLVAGDAVGQARGSVRERAFARGASGRPRYSRRTPSRPCGRRRARPAWRPPGGRRAPGLHYRHQARRPAATQSRACCNTSRSRAFIGFAGTWRCPGLYSLY